MDNRNLKAPDDDGQVRAVGIAEMTTGAIFWGCHDGDMSILVENQHLGWTEFDAYTAAFAPLVIDEYLPTRKFVTLAGCCVRKGIGWNVICHAPCSYVESALCV
jgi:hypothetical protein